MIQYRRLPSLLVLLVLSGLTAGYVAREPRSGPAAATPATCPADVDKAVAGGAADGATWLRYGDHLRSQRRYSEAADAFARVLDQQPFDREARFGRATMLALAQRNDEFHAFMRDLVYSDAKLAVDLFGRPECQPCLRDGRFAPLIKEARSQAAD